MYASVSNVRAHKVAGATVDLSMYEDSEITAALEISESFINAHIQRVFGVTEDVSKIVDGTGSEQLFFSPYFAGPVQEVTAVDEVDEDGESTYSYELTDFVVRPYFLRLREDDQSDPRRGLLRCKGRWPKGTQNIKITGTWGEAVPTAVQRASILLALEALIPGSTQLTPCGVAGERWEDYEIRYAQGGAPPSVDSTGFDYIDRLLAPFKISPTLFTTVE
jgi:hypothetical protein